MDVLKQWVRKSLVIPEWIRCNPNSEFIGRKLFRYFPVFLPHDKSYWGFRFFVRHKDGLFLDIGANDGISALGFRRIHRQYRIMSIEPNYCHAYALKRLKQRHLDRFDFKIIGAGQRKGQMILYIPVFQGVPLYSAASMDREYALGTIRNIYGPRHEEAVVVELKIEIIPLDDLGLDPDIIKIDTEGHDLDVLRGLVNTVSKYRPVILIEYNADKVGLIEAFLKPLEYRLMTFDHVRDVFSRFNQDGGDLPDVQKVRSNIFCVPEERTIGLPLGKEG